MTYQLENTENTTYVYVTENTETLVTVYIGVQGEKGLSGLISQVLNQTQSSNITASQQGAIFTNNNANAEIDLSLPVVPQPFIPLSFSLLVTAAETFSFIAPAGVVISNGSDSSSTGGSISSNTIGNFVTLTLISTTQWIVTSIVGFWELN